jgi:maleylacetate reductase
MSIRFTSEWQRCRVVFASGARTTLGAELDALSLGRALIVRSPGRSQFADEIAGTLDQRLAGVCALAAPHVPAECVAAALAETDRARADAIVAVGGGSAVGLAKAIALNRSLPIIALPTTYAGSEMTSVYGMTEDGKKRTGRDARVAPRLVIYDPDLTMSLPAGVSAASGMNAIAHAVEAMYAGNVSPIATAAAAEAIASLSRSLPRIVATPLDPDARALAMRGAHLAGIALELATMGLHHKICHVLGGSFGLPHAETHAVLLPHVVAFNAPAAPDAMARIAAALGTSDAAQGLRDLNASFQLPASLATLGFKASDVARAAELVTAATYPNPRLASASDIRDLLTAAL